MLGIWGQLRIPFFDMNGTEAFARKEWLFVDRVHLTDTRCFAGGRDRGLLGIPLPARCGPPGAA